MAALALGAGVSPVAASTNVGPNTGRAARHPAHALVDVASPSALTAHALQTNDGTVLVTWGGQNGSTSFDVYRSATAGSQGSKLNSTPLRGDRYDDTTAQAGTQYYYTVVGLTAHNGQVTTITSPQVANTATAAAPAPPASARKPVAKTKTSHTHSGTKSSVNRAQTQVPHVLSGTGICNVQLPDTVLASETNFGCPSGTTIVQLLRQVGEGTDCTTLNSGNGDCDVYIGDATHAVTETVGTGIVVYIDNPSESTPKAGDPTDKVDLLTYKGSSLIFNAAPTAPAGVKSINEEPGSTTAPADGDWGTIEYGYNGTNTQNETATAPSFGYVQDTNFSYGTDFWIRESTIPFTADVIRSMLGTGPIGTLPGANVVEWDLSADPAANPAGVHNLFVNGTYLIGDAGTTNEEGFFFNEVSPHNNNAPDFTFSNNNVSSASNPVDVELTNDNSSGPVSGNLTVHMFGDTAQNDWGSSYLQSSDETDANGGNDSLSLDVHDNHAANNLQAGGLQDLADDYVLDAEVFSGTGNATLAGTVAATHLGGATEGMFAYAESDQSGAGSTGNASISGLALMNDNFTSTGSSDGAFDGEAYAEGAGNSDASPTLQGNIFNSTGSDAVDLYAESFYGAGNATVSPNLIGGYYHGNYDAVYQDAEISTSNGGTGSATANGSFNTGDHLLADTHYGRSSYAHSNLGPATDSPSFNNTVVEAPNTSNGTAVHFDRDQIYAAPSTAALTVKPTFTATTLNAGVYGLYGDSFVNDGNGNSTFSPSFTSSTINSLFADAVHASLYDYGTGGSVAMDPTLSGSTFSSREGYGIHFFNEVHGKNTDMSPSLVGSTINSFFSALHLHNYATYGADSGTATTDPTVTSSTLDANTGDVVDSEAFSYTSAVVDPAITLSTLKGGVPFGCCFIALGGGPFFEAVGNAYDATHAGNAEALPAFTSDTIVGEGPTAEAFADMSGNSGAAGSAKSGGAVTGGSISSNFLAAFLSEASQANGQGATSNVSVNNATLSSTDWAGVESFAFGWSNTTSTTPTLSTSSLASVTNSQVTSHYAGAVAKANDVSDNTGTLPAAASTGPVSADVETSGSKYQTASDASVGAISTTDFIAGAVSATTNDHNSPLDGYYGDQVLEAVSSNGRCYNGNNCGTVSQVTTSATGPATTTGSLTSDTSNMQVTNQSGAPDYIQITSADNAAASSMATIHNVTSSASEPVVSTASDANNTSGADNTTTTVNVTNYTNDGTKGQSGISVTNNAPPTGTGQAVNSGIFDNVSVGQFQNAAGLGWFTSSGSGDSGTVSVTNSNFTGGSGWDGLDIESSNPNASPHAPILYAMGDLIANVTGGDGIYDFGFVPEVIGNDIYGISGGVDVQEAAVSHSATLVHRTAERPAVPETANGTISGNYLHDSDQGIQLDADVTLSPNVNYNDFAGPDLGNGPSGNPPGSDLKVLSTDNTLHVDATNNWWGTTSATLIAGLYSTAGAVVTVSPSLASPMQSSGFTLDAWGGVHQYGGAPAVPITGYWPGHNVARGITTSPDGLGGYTLDYWGGVHPFGNITTPPAITAYWPGWDIARGIAQIPGSPTKGYVLDGWGGVHPFGGAPAVTITGYWPGWDIAKGIVVNPPSHLNTCVSGYVLDGWGGIHPFADTTSSGCSGANMPAVPSGFAYWPGWNIARGIGLQAYGQGYVVDGWGGVHQFGGAQPVTITGWWPGTDIARSIVVTPLGTGYTLDGYGGVHQFSYAPPVVISGYWLGSDIAKGIS